jgi:hypothetical protein
MYSNWRIELLLRVPHPPFRRSLQLFPVNGLKRRPEKLDAILARVRGKRGGGGNNPSK